MRQKVMSKQSISELRKFASDTIWVGVSQALTTILGIVTVPVLTKSYTSEIYGSWTQVKVTAALLTTILSLELGNALVKFLAGEESKQRRTRAFAAMLYPMLALSCLMFIASLLFRGYFSLFVFAKAEYAFLIPLTFLFAASSALRIFLSDYLRARGEIKKQTIIGSTLSVVKMALLIVLAKGGHTLRWIVVSFVVAEALSIVVIFISILSDIDFPRPSRSFRQSARFLAFSVPIVPIDFLLWIIACSDRYFIAHFLNLSQVGIYSVSYGLGSLISLFYWPISFVLFPSASRAWEQGDGWRVRRYFEYSTKLFLAFSVPSAVGLCILSQPLLRILSTSEYVVGGELVLLVGLGTVLQGIYQINVYIPLLLNQTKWLPLMVSAAAAINAGVNVVLIPKMGIVAAAISTMVSYFVLGAVLTHWARRAVNYRIDLKFLAKVLIATLIMMVSLKAIEIRGILRIGLAIVVGAAVFGASLFLLGAWSRKEIALLKQVVSLRTQ